MTSLCASLSLVVSQPEGWQEQYAPSAPWWGWVLALLSFGLMGVLLWRARQHRDLYRIDRALSDDASERVHEAIRRAEERTVGEIVPVLLGRSDRYPAADLMCGMLFGMAGYFGAWSLPLGLGPAGLLLGALGFGWLGWWGSRRFPELRRHFVTPARVAEMAEEQAFQEFYKLGLHKTEAQTGVLIFVSLFERRVIVLGDEGIDAKLDAEHWKAVDQKILASAREGRLADGLCEAIEAMGDSLQEHFPWQEGDRNELPDRLVLRDE